MEVKLDDMEKMRELRGLFINKITSPSTIIHEVHDREVFDYQSFYDDKKKRKVPKKFKKIFEDFEVLLPHFKELEENIKHFGEYITFTLPNRNDIRKTESFLMNYEVEEIKEFYRKKGEGEIDLKVLDKILTSTEWMPFFLKFEKSTRVKLMKNCDLVLFERGEFVVRQGEVGDCMYVILRGSCNVLIKIPDPKKKGGFLQLVRKNSIIRSQIELNALQN